MANLVTRTIVKSITFNVFEVKAGIPQSIVLTTKQLPTTPTAKEQKKLAKELGVDEIFLSIASKEEETLACLEKDFIAIAKPLETLKAELKAEKKQKVENK